MKFVFLFSKPTHLSFHCFFFQNIFFVIQQTTQKLLCIIILISSLEMKVSGSDQSDHGIVNENDQCCKLLQYDHFNLRNEIVNDLK